jgi:hypothetical protein
MFLFKLLIVLLFLSRMAAFAFASITKNNQGETMARVCQVTGKKPMVGKILR